MNKDRFKQVLSSSAETRATVSDELHQRVMNSVRLSKAQDRTGISRWSMPAWGLGLTAAAVAVFYLTQTQPVSVPRPDVPGLELSSPTVTDHGVLMESANTNPVPALLLTLQQETTVQEEVLRKELERLKSDLKRFDFRS